MKSFLIKFLILFSIIYGFIGIYTLYIKPNLSGDIGNLGQIAFGHNYTKKLQEPYLTSQKLVINYTSELRIADSIITIGDSFSQQGDYGYSQFMAKMLQSKVLNIYDNNHHVPEQSFIKLTNNNKIPKGSIVIIESVERNMIGRLANLNFTDSTMFNIYPNPPQGHVDLLSRTIMWIKYSVLKNSPIIEFSTTKELFSHDKIHQEIYIYNNDLKFNKITKKDYDKAVDNLYKLWDFAVKHDIQMIYLIAADKYDVYEPFIYNAPLKNTTLDYIPYEKWIVNSKSILQKSVYDDVKDVYYINDSHWSPVGAKIVGEEVAKRIKLLYNN